MTELEKLKEYLDKNGYKNDWREVVSPKYQVVVYDPKTGERLWDAVCHKWSYGGNRGLLEIYGSICEDVVGHLTAEGVIKILEEKKK